MIDPLLASAFAGVGAACVLSYLLGRWHGTEAALSYRFPDEMASDWPPSLRGDLPNVPVHSPPVAEERQHDHA